MWPKPAAGLLNCREAAVDLKRSPELFAPAFTMPTVNLELHGVSMSLEQYSYLAEIIASIAVVASLLFVALEIRKNTRESELANYGSVVDRYMAVYRRTDNIELANLVAKGRESYSDLSEGEKISFGHYLEQMCIANEGILVLSEELNTDRDANLALFRKHIRYHLGFVGSREWYDEFEKVRGFPPQFAASIRDAIE